MDDLLSYRKIILSTLENYLQEQRKKTSRLNPWQTDIVNRLESSVSSGKLLRGCLVCFTNQAFGGHLIQRAAQVGAAVELIHTALLIHDDIIDQDEIRRGSPTLHRQYEMLTAKEPEHFGKSMAICVADAAIFMGFDVLGRGEMPATAKTELLRLFGTTLTTVCGGQMLDIDMGMKTRKVTKQTIITIMQQKTAGYSVALPLTTGAILAQQPKQTIDMLNELGKHIGTIFQIRDDELGIFGSPTATGKSVGSDIKEGKKTLLYYYAFKLCPPEAQMRLKKIFGNQNASLQDIDYVQETLAHCNVPEALDQEVIKLTKAAFQLIEQLPWKKTDKDSLQKFVGFCAQRNS